MSGGNSLSSILQLARAGLLLMVVGWAVGCAKPEYDPDTAGAECGLPVDTHGSFMTRLNRDHVAKAYIDSSFTAYERAGIERAIRSWNTFGESSPLRRSYFAVETDSIGDKEKPLHSKDCSFDGGDDRFRIVRETDEALWSAFQLTSANPGVTVRCSQGKRLARQTVFLNLKHIQAEQIETLALHELGHSLGLDHSCTLTGGSKRYAACAGLGGEHPYRVAVMFPILIGGADSAFSDIKESPTPNDRERAQCVYSIP